MATNLPHHDELADAGLPADVILRPFRNFTRLQASGGLVLIAATVAALVWANGPWRESYAALWEKTYLTLGVGEHAFSMSILHWINDFVMAAFFLLVGLEIKREILVGELASVRKAALPIAAAIGGMVVPGLLYAAVNASGDFAHGWGIPMATDIAFALGVLTLLGPRIPVALKVFLASLAIVDDIGALLVIAIFYTHEISLGHLLGAGGVVALLAACNWMGFRSPLLYMAVGVVVWALVYRSGVHATIAGVLVAATIPARARVRTDRFVDAGRRALETVEREARPGTNRLVTNANVLGAMFLLHRVSRDVTTPLQRIEHAHLPWISFLVVPLFALANAGVTVGEDVGTMLGSRVTSGIALGLVIGKPVGILGASWLAVRAGVAALPTGTTWRHVVGAGFLGGIGFTMSLFIANLAFADGGALTEGKLGILLASLVSGIAGWAILVRGPGRPPAA